MTTKMSIKQFASIVPYFHAASVSNSRDEINSEIALY
jgi:hypothetical protein